MKKTLLFLGITIVLHLGTKAQCNARFTYVINNNLVYFSSDSLMQGSSVWNFGDGSVGWSSYTQHSYTSPGSYAVTHFVYDSLNNCNDSATMVINLNFTPSCSASFISFQDSINLRGYHFTDASNVIGGYADSIQWTINNNVVASGSSFNYIFPSTGTYQVCEHIHTNFGCISQSCQNISITSADSCHINAAFNYYTESTNPFTVEFAPLFNTNSNISYLWNFGDGSSDSTASPVHTYSMGTYVASLYEFLKDSNGIACSGYYSATISANNNPPIPCSLQAAFTYAPEPSNPLAIQFTPATASVSNISYIWYFGDGSTDSTKNPVHIYSPGTYAASLYIYYTDSANLICSSQDTSFVYVNGDSTNTCSASFTYTGNTKPNTINFTAQSSQPIVSETWDIANTIQNSDSGINYFNADTINYTVINGINPMYTFPDSGVYWVRVNVITQTGCNVTTNWQPVYTSTVITNAPARDTNSLVIAYPNPANNTVNLSLTLPGNSIVTINVFSSTGDLIMTKQISGTAGNNQIPIVVQALKSGIYYVQINYGNQTSRSRFQKM